MHQSKKEKPSGVCTVCQASFNKHEALNHRCDKVLTGRRCAGVVKSAVNTLWDECESCHATGKVGPLPCRECAGFGWRIYA
jgi:DnaJ-class molecular chaperone